MFNSKWKERALRLERQLTLERTLRIQAESARDMLSKEIERQQKISKAYQVREHELVRELSVIRGKLNRWIEYRPNHSKGPR